MAAYRKQQNERQEERRLQEHQRTGEVWYCTRCEIENFPLRVKCFKCSAPRDFNRYPYPEDANPEEVSKRRRGRGGQNKKRRTGEEANDNAQGSRASSSGAPYAPGSAAASASSSRSQIRGRTTGEDAQQLLNRRGGSGPFQTPNAHFSSTAAVFIAGAVGFAALFAELGQEVKRI